MFAKIVELAETCVSLTSDDLTVYGNLAPATITYQNGYAKVSLNATMHLDEATINVYSSGNGVGVPVRFVRRSSNAVTGTIKSATLLGFSNSMTLDADTTIRNLMGDYELHGLLYRLVAAHTAITCGGCMINTVEIPNYPTKLHELNTPMAHEIYILPNRNSAGFDLEENMLVCMSAVCQEDCGVVPLNNIQIPDYVNHIPKCKLYMVQQAANNGRPNITRELLWSCIMWLADLMPDFSDTFDSMAALIACRMCLLSCDTGLGMGEAYMTPELYRSCLDVANLIKCGAFTTKTFGDAMLALLDMQATVFGHAMTKAQLQSILNNPDTKIYGVALKNLTYDVFANNFNTVSKRVGFVNKCRSLLGAEVLRSYHDGQVQHRYKRSAIGVNGSFAIPTSSGGSLLYNITKGDDNPGDRYVSRYTCVQDQQSCTDMIVRTALSVRSIVDYLYTIGGMSRVNMFGSVEQRTAAAKLMAEDKYVKQSQGVLTFDPTAWIPGIFSVAKYMPLGSVPCTLPIETINIKPEVMLKPLFLSSDYSVDTCLPEAVRLKIFPENIADAHPYLAVTEDGWDRHAYYVNQLAQEKKNKVAGLACDSWEIPGVSCRISFSYSYEGEAYYTHAEGALYKTSITCLGGTRQSYFARRLATGDAGSWHYTYVAEPTLCVGLNSIELEQPFTGVCSLRTFRATYFEDKITSGGVLSPMLHGFNFSVKTPNVKTCSVEELQKVFTITDGGKYVRASGFLKKREERPAKDKSS